MKTFDQLFNSPVITRESHKTIVVRYATFKDKCLGIFIYLFIYLFIHLFIYLFIYFLFIDFFVLLGFFWSSHLYT